MSSWEVWEYGYGDGGRLRYRAPSEEKAVKAFLDRKVASGKTFRELLKERRREKIIVCVKDPTLEGTQENPNYPSVHSVEVTERYD